jgi:hypothetical protein
MCGDEEDELEKYKKDVLPALVRKGEVDLDLRCSLRGLPERT